MSRHTRSEFLSLFQIEVLDFSKKNGHGHNFGTKVVGETIWQYGKNIYSRPDRMKQVDRVRQAPRRTLMKRAKNGKVATSWAKRFGSVISCKKVDISFYRNNIECLNLHQEPIEIEIDKQEFELGKDFVITKSGVTIGELGIDI